MGTIQKQITEHLIQMDLSKLQVPAAENLQHTVADIRVGLSTCEQLPGSESSSVCDIQFCSSLKQPLMLCQIRRDYCTKANICSSD